MNIAMVAVLFLFQQVYAPADFTQVSGATLKARYDTAIAQAGRASDESYWVGYRFPVRPDVRINTFDNNIQISSTTSSDGFEWIPTETEPQRIGVFLMIGKSDGLIQKTRIVNLSQNFRIHDRRVYWLGEPNADESLALLSSFALSPVQKSSSSLLHYISLHDSPNMTNRLLAIARDSANTLEVRRNALNYLGRQINQQATQELERLSQDPSSDIQNAAVQAISRRPDDEAIPALIRIAKDHPKQTVRQQAVRTLSQKKDPRVVDFFEQVLKKK